MARTKDEAGDHGVAADGDEARKSPDALQRRSRPHGTLSVRPARE